MRVSKMTVYRLVHNGELPAVPRRPFVPAMHAKAVHDLLEPPTSTPGDDARTSGARRERGTNRPGDDAHLGRGGRGNSTGAG